MEASRANNCAGIRNDRSPTICRSSSRPRDAITNLVDNAIKYGPQGSQIDIAVRADTTEALLTVSDQGPGIPAEHRERIFDRFYRLDEGRSRGTGGTGLGLAIAKWAVEANGGNLSLVPSRAGATFRITLSLAPAETKSRTSAVSGEMNR